MKKIEFTPTVTVSMLLILELVLIISYAFMEKIQNNSYLGFIALFSVAAIILSNALMKMVEGDYERKISNLKSELYSLHREMMSHTMNHTKKDSDCLEKK